MYNIDNTVKNVILVYSKMAFFAVFKKNVIIDRKYILKLLWGTLIQKDSLDIIKTLSCNP